ncbi:Agamous-like MADS-box protein AGL9-like protein [Hibiscus syriacus]|uniref:Agamous-like MADS-box protein AGL9-like protein n=1 Tax=Hibiscus syriacus TaxID=106335 RepID=A0A6A3C4U0_HIBSY|nr:Agamous-like MADS-box protein AGL9-like protein [Hibiscus syriacus]
MCLSVRTCICFSMLKFSANLLKARYEAFQRSQGNLLGEDLGPLSRKELESLERQPDSSLKLIRSTREHLLNEANRTLKQRLMEGYQVNSLQSNPNVEDVGYGDNQLISLRPAMSSSIHWTASRHCISDISRIRYRRSPGVRV